MIKRTNPFTPGQSYTMASASNTFEERVVVYLKPSMIGDRHIFVDVNSLGFGARRNYLNFPSLEVGADEFLTDGQKVALFDKIKPTRVTSTCVSDTDRRVIDSAHESSLNLILETVRGGLGQLT